MPKLKPGTIFPTAEEDAAIARGIAADPDAYELTAVEIRELRPYPKRGRPVSPAPKAHVNIRLSAHVVEFFKSQGAGWQTRINAALSDWIAHRGR